MLKVGKCLLLDLLQKRNLSQSDFAIKLNMTKQQVNAYITNRNVMSLQTAVNVAFVLRCEISDLYEFEEVSEE